MFWAMKKSILDDYQAAKKNFPTKEIDLNSGSQDQLYTVKDGIAHIDIKGVLTNEPDFFAMIFGGGNTTYEGLIEATRLANEDNQVEGIRYVIDSPGGQASAMQVSAMDAIYNSVKPTESLVVNQACSAAYGLASQTGKIVAMNRASEVGSIGVVATCRVNDEMISITSTKAPLKRPDIKTEEGIAAIKEELDEMHEQFVSNIARGRGVTPKEIDENYGHGATFLADKALSQGMFDEILEYDTSNNNGENNMDKEAIQAMIKEAVTASEQKFSGEINSLKEENKTLKSQLDAEKEAKKTAEFNAEKTTREGIMAAAVAFVPDTKRADALKSLSEFSSGVATEKLAEFAKTAVAGYMATNFPNISYKIDASALEGNGGDDDKKDKEIDLSVRQVDQLEALKKAMQAIAL